jgi:hypothetical protein
VSESPWAPPSAFTTPVTEQFGERLAHQVFDIQSAVQDDLLRTMCGQLIVPAPLTSPVGAPCAACAEKIAHGRRSSGRRARGVARVMTGWWPYGRR